MTSVNIQQVLSSGELTMTSLEVAELVNKRHDNVLVKIREMVKNLEKYGYRQDGISYWINHLPSGGRPIQNHVMKRSLGLLLLTELKAPLDVRYNAIHEFMSSEHRD